MKSVLFPLAILVSVATAQTTSAAAAGATGTSDCAADYILETCLTSETAKFDACDTNDWNCKCASYDAILTCYNNCPNDPRKSQAEGQRAIFCGYATQFPSSTTRAAAATGTGSGQTSMSTATTTGTETGTSSSSATGAAKTNAAVDLAMNAGGVLAAVAGVVFAML